MIRQFQPEDAPSCCRLIQACLEGDALIPSALREKLRAGETPQSMNERARLFYGAVFKAENEILGIAGLDMNEIRLLYVSPKHQRRGIGRALFEHVKAMVPDTLFADIFVYSAIQAAGFYRACGFVEKGPFSFDLGPEALPLIFMTFQLIR
jgi:GNAT superfamily N-acetyltransferase